MNDNKRKRKGGRLAWLLAAVVACGSLACPMPAWAAASDPALRFDLTSNHSAENLREGDRVEVNLVISREDGQPAPSELASITVDIDYNNELFDASTLKTPGLLRPDGQQWAGNWSCSLIPAGNNTSKVRVVYYNMSGLMMNPPRLESFSGKLTAASFILTAKKDAPGISSPVTFHFIENGDKEGNLSPSVAGTELTLQFSAADSSDSGSNGSSGSSGSGGNSGADSGSGGSSGTDGSAGSGTGSGGTGSGSINSGAGGGSGSGGAGSGTAVSPESGAVPGPNVCYEDLTDMPIDHWASEYVRYMVERGILSGNENKEFQPDENVSRAEFCQMISAAFNYEPADADMKTVFKDVKAEDWYFGPVMALHRAGVVAGTGDGLFGAEDQLSRQDMAVIISRVMKDKNISFGLQRTYPEFRDQNQVEDYARVALMDLYCTGIISGTETDMLSPSDNSTRAQAATVLYNIIKKQEGR